MDRSSNTISVIRERRLAAPRYACSIRGRIAVNNHETYCDVFDISDSGIGIHVDSVVRLTYGLPVIVTAPQLGSLRATVRWVMVNRAGLAFTPNSNNLSHVKELIAALEAKRINET